jgi:hypothetical protein
MLPCVRFARIIGLSHRVPIVRHGNPPRVRAAKLTCSDMANSLDAAIISPKTGIATVDIWHNRIWHVRHLGLSISD